MPTGFRLGEFVVEPDADRLIQPGTAVRVDLEPKAMAVLVVLAERSGQVVCSDELIRCVWHGRPMGDNPVYKAVAKLRRALRDDAGAPRYIETISRKGYRLLVEPQPLAIACAETPADATSTLPKPKPTLGRRVSLALATWLGVASLTAFYLMWPQFDTRAPAALSRLPAETQLLYESARLELKLRRPGFAHRLRRDAEALIEDAPGLADAHALRAVACSLELGGSARASVIWQSERLHCARESSLRALELDRRSPLAIVAARFAERERAGACASIQTSACLEDTLQAVAVRPVETPDDPKSVRLARVR